jgi:hypothetical protein
MEGVPFAIAFQDFHAQNSMELIVPAMTEYAFGVRHSIENGRQKIEWINEHKFGSISAKSGFFRLPNSENISAIIVNPQGTLAKFNRIGYISGFGDRRVRMTRRSIRRNDGNRSDPRPTLVVEDVHDGNYKEKWVEGMVILHNPHSRSPISPHMIRDATHKFLQSDGSIMSMLSEIPTYLSSTFIYISSK